VIAWRPRRVEWPVAVAPQRRTRKRARTRPRKVALRRWTGPSDVAPRSPAQLHEKDPDARPADHRRIGCVVRSARSSCHRSSSSRGHRSVAARPAAGTQPYATPPATATADQPLRRPTSDSGTSRCSRRWPRDPEPGTRATSLPLAATEPGQHRGRTGRGRATSGSPERSMTTTTAPITGRNSASRSDGFLRKRRAKTSASTSSGWLPRRQRMLGSSRGCFQWCTRFSRVIG
jgi:hypothetical protein